VRNTGISVAIASYNGARHIAAQLESIAAQSTMPDELIVSDDASTDDTVAIVERFASTAPFPVRMIRHAQNIGILENFYAAFAQTSGEFIYYCDQDDFWLPDKIGRVQAAFGAGIALVAHPSAIVDGDLVAIGKHEPLNRKAGRITAPFDSVNVRAFGHQLAFRRPVFEAMVALRHVAEAHAANIGCNFDTYIPLCASLIGGAVVIDKPLTLFRRHGGATTGAGIVAESPLTLRQRAIRSLSNVADIADRLAIVGDAVEQNIGLANATYGALLKRHARAAALAPLLAKPRLGQVISLPKILRIAGWSTGATNDNRAHNLALATIAVVA
jgi:hypothetical protein